MICDIFCCFCLVDADALVLLRLLLLLHIVNVISTINVFMVLTAMVPLQCRHTAANNAGTIAATDTAPHTSTLVNTICAKRFYKNYKRAIGAIEGPLTYNNYSVTGFGMFLLRQLCTSPGALLKF